MIETAIAEYATWGPLTVTTFVVTIGAPVLGAIFTLTSMSNAKKIIEGKNAELSELQLEYAKVERGLRQEISEFEKGLAPAVQARFENEYRSGNYAKAWRELEAVRQTLEPYAIPMGRLALRDSSLLLDDPSAGYDAAFRSAALAFGLSKNRNAGPLADLFYQKERLPSMLTNSVGENWLVDGGHSIKYCWEASMAFLNIGSPQLGLAFAERAFAPARRFLKGQEPMSFVHISRFMLDALELDTAHTMGNTVEWQIEIATEAKSVLENSGDMDLREFLAPILDRHLAEAYLAKGQIDRAEALIVGALPKIRSQSDGMDGSLSRAIHVDMKVKVAKGQDVTDQRRALFDAHLEQEGIKANSTIKLFCEWAEDAIRLRQFDYVMAALDEHEDGIRGSPIFWMCEHRINAIKQSLSDERAAKDVGPLRIGD